MKARLAAALGALLVVSLHAQQPQQPPPATEKTFTKEVGRQITGVINVTATVSELPLVPLEL